MILLISSAIASADNLKFTARYDAYWSGVRVGKAILDIEETNNTYKANLHLGAKGIAKKISKYWSSNSASGVKQANKYTPTNYTTHYNRKKENRKITANFANNAVDNITITPPEREGKRPFLTDAQKQDVLDPISVALQIREKLKEVRDNGYKLPYKFTMPVFDGKRKFNLHITVKGLVKRKAAKTKEIWIQTKRQAIEGFSHNELKRMKTNEPIMDIYIDTKTLLPTYGIGKAPIGYATIKLVKYCNDDKDACF